MMMMMMMMIRIFGWLSYKFSAFYEQGSSSQRKQETATGR
jgi:hypothetical protein